MNTNAGLFVFCISHPILFILSILSKTPRICKIVGLRFFGQDGEDEQDGYG